MNSTKFTQKTKSIIDKSSKIAIRNNDSYIGTEHLLLSILETKNCIANDTLISFGITATRFQKELEKVQHNAEFDENSIIKFSTRAKSVIEKSLNEAIASKAELIGTEHLLLALIKETDGKAVNILKSLKVDIEKMKELLNITINGFNSNVAGQSKKSDRPKKTTSPTLDQYSRDYTLMAERGEFDPISCREPEIERIMQILCRRTKNNPCLVGEPGVGKTAIIEGLAQKIVDGDIPEQLRDRRVVALDLSSVLAGSKYRGEFEERIKKIIGEVLKDGSIILFIDEFHTIIGAGGAEGAIDASNILKPLLSRGELQVIGATTLTEYRKHIEKDSALERRFQQVSVVEPSVENAISMLFSLKSKYEDHHNVTIEDDAIVGAVRLSDRYISDRFLPDKAIDLIDEAASKIKLEVHVMPEDIKSLQSRLAQLESEKEIAIIDEDFIRATEIKEEQQSIIKKIEGKVKRFETKVTKDQHTVTIDNITDVIASWTGINVKKINQTESEKLLKLEEILHNKIIGQDNAVTAVAKAIRRSRVGLKNENKPIGSFLFLGPTGVGKTELTKVLTETMFSSVDDLIRVDMSEFMEKHSVSKLIGAPPGYVGFEEGGQLSEKVRKKPYSVILFDEIEKAHPDVYNMFLQILDDGILTDSQGKTVDFKNTIIIMTSNIGARNIVGEKKLGFDMNKDDKANNDEIKKLVMAEIKNVFKPEFLNRIDDVIVFEMLNKDDIMKISKILLDELCERALRNIGVKVNYTDDILNFVSEKGFDQKYGARPLKRAIQSNIEDVLAEYILLNGIKFGDELDLVMVDDKLEIKTLTLVNA